MSLQDVTAGLRRDPSGIWLAGSGTEALSFPPAGNTDSFAVEANSFWFAHRNRVIAAAAARFRPAGTLFDVGGGNGYVAAGLQRAGVDVAVIEPGPVGARNARDRGVTTVICGTLEQVGFRPATVAAFGLFDVLEHIESPQPFLSSMRELLCSDGLLFITVPAYSWLWSLEDEYGGHYRRYTLTQLKSSLVAAGFAVAFATYFFACLPPAVFLLRSVPERLGVRREFSHAAASASHVAPAGMAGRLLERCLEWELGRLTAGRTLPFGASCLVVARRNDSLGDAAS